MVENNIWIANSSIKELIDQCTFVKSPDLPDLYRLVYMELVDRIKEDPKSCAEVAKEILSVL